MAAANFLKELEQLANPAPMRDDEDHEDEGKQSDFSYKTWMGTFLIVFSHNSQSCR